MRLAAVVCEFNPFHNGHAYLLSEARAKTGCDAVICVMSGNFTQRARPAVADMRVRAHTALLNGADAVIELPALYATACGERFAAGAVNIINTIPEITHLVFGSESGDLNYLQRISEAQLEESPFFKQTLKDALDKGMPYAAAYSLATEAAAGGAAPKPPNDLLGVEYLKQLARTGSPVIPIAVKRIGAGYHDSENKGAFSSAAAIRALFENGNPDAAREAVPESAFKLLSSYIGAGKAANKNFELLAIAALRNRDFSRCPDAGEGLELKLRANALRYTSLDKIVAETKSKRYTEARIRRLCLQALLHIEDNEPDFIAVKTDPKQTVYPAPSSLPSTRLPFAIPYPIPAKLIGVRESLKDAILRTLPKNIIVKNKDFSAYAAAQVAAQRVWSVNQAAARIFPLLFAYDGEFYASLPLLTVCDKE